MLTISELLISFAVCVGGCLVGVALAVVASFCILYFSWMKFGPSDVLAGLVTVPMILVGLISGGVGALCLYFHLIDFPTRHI